MTETIDRDDLVDEDDEDDAPERRRRPSLPRFPLAGWALILAATVFLGWSCWGFWDMRQGGDQDMARARDRVVTAAEQQIAVLNTMNAKQIDKSLQRWLDVSTGTLHEQLRSTMKRNKTQVGDSKTSATGRVEDVAVARLDMRVGEATVIATVRIEVTPPGAATTVQRKRFEAALARVGDGWKLKSLTAIPVDSR